MIDSFKIWLAANHLDVLWALFLAYFFPALLQAMMNPPKGSKAYAALGALSAWGFDPRKFVERVIELADRTGGPPGNAGGANRALASVRPMVAATLFTLGCLRACKGAKVPAEAELLLHAADSACGVVALLHDAGADAVCLGVSDLDQLDQHLAAAETAQKDAPLVVEAKDGARRKLRVRAPHVRQARAAVSVARMDVADGGAR